MDREKVIRAFEQYVYNFVELTTTDEYNHQILEQVLVLLKEQEKQIENQIHNFEFLAERQQPQIVRCKDCRHHGRDICSAGAGMAFPPPDDWYCADGERKL